MAQEAEGRQPWGPARSKDPASVAGGPQVAQAAEPAWASAAPSTINIPSHVSPRLSFLAVWATMNTLG